MVAGWALERARMSSRVFRRDVMVTEDHSWERNSVKEACNSLMIDQNLLRSSISPRIADKLSFMSSWTSRTLDAFKSFDRSFTSLRHAFSNRLKDERATSGSSFLPSGLSLLHCLFRESMDSLSMPASFSTVLTTRAMLDRINSIFASTKVLSAKNAL
ncbi:hypothetical protein OGATHE_001861 [Ogataea polymorpha]|uniref:Uncharacterized protein n=1 Tax=Ogataea polymorpha TaxID=460523 RepID=A0A9P8TD36_9ASCO|nr:hypothetical protein OGATHE_001861 [Ogataea polymorpha]